MTKRNFQKRAQTFGLDTQSSWALQTLRLLFSVPRAYEPLVASWEIRYPGTRKNLAALTKDGWLQYQKAVVVDTRTALVATKKSRPIPRYKTTARGKALLVAVKEDVGHLESIYPRVTNANIKKVARLLTAYNLKDSNAKFGISIPHAVASSNLPERSGRWWTIKLLEDGYIRKMDDLADTRELIPQHWCVTRSLCTQLQEIVAAFPDTAPASLITEFRLKRTRFNDFIDPNRVGIAGATDFDHDVQTQTVLATLLLSPQIDLGGLLTVEPRMMLPIDNSTPNKLWEFRKDGPNRLAYQPDAEFRERSANTIVRSILEYERYQSRSDGWSHIERFLGYIHTSSLSFEPAILRFVVETDARAKSYIKLIEAFADHAAENPHLMPVNDVTLAVTSTSRLQLAKNPLDLRSWSWVKLANPVGLGKSSDTASNPVLHPEKTSPYWQYFKGK